MSENEKKNKKLDKPPKPGLKRFEVKQKKTRMGVERAIFVDGEFFDWEADKQSLEWAAKQGADILAATQKDVAEHFLKSLSEFVGRDLTMRDFILANQKGWI